jgi:CBS domain-containing protein
MQQLYHFKEINGTSYPTFGTGCLFLFFCPYFLFAAITSGTFAPAGLFVPTLLSGATFGRIVGHILNAAFPYYVADSGTYALIGAAAVLGGMSRSTIAGTVIVLEACGNNGYILPLMLTFAAARYTGNALNESMYDMQIELKKMPFLEGTLRTAGLINYHPITEVMAQPAITLKEINSVRAVYEMLALTSHNGFPVVSDDGHLKGFILRKTLCGLLKLKAFSSPAASHSRVVKALGGEVEMKRRKGKQSEQEKDSEVRSPDSTATQDVDNDSSAENMEEEEEETKDDKEVDERELDGDMITLTAGATVFHQTLEKNYPLYPSIKEIDLTPSELVSYIAVRSPHSTAAFSP